MQLPDNTESPLMLAFVEQEDVKHSCLPNSEAALGRSWHCETVTGNTLGAALMAHGGCKCGRCYSGIM